MEHLYIQQQKIGYFKAIRAVLSRKPTFVTLSRCSVCSYPWADIKLYPNLKYALTEQCERVLRGMSKGLASKIVCCNKLVCSLKRLAGSSKPERITYHAIILLKYRVTPWQLKSAPKVAYPRKLSRYRVFTDIGAEKSFSIIIWQHFFVKNSTLTLYMKNKSSILER